MILLFWTVLLFGMWIILTSNFQISNILVGIGVSFSISLVYLKLFTHKAFESINPFWFMVYLFVLLKNLIISNMQISKRVLRRDMKLSPAIVAVKTDLDSDWKKLLLANSITLTPGTLTLDIKDDKLFIHVIEYNEGSNKENITKEFEDIIAKV
ncbi:MAG: Na+/H+ antiporter subunit E [Sulfurovum sp.]|nr:Na+/H+ antiporter subunit E [Sulfurovum sp.]